MSCDFSNLSFSNSNFLSLFQQNTRFPHNSPLGVYRQCADYREILISHLLGHTLWQECLRSWSQEEELIGMEWKIDEEEKCTVNVYQSNWEKQGADRDPEI